MKEINEEELKNVAGSSDPMTVCYAGHFADSCPRGYNYNLLPNCKYQCCKQGSAGQDCFTF